MSKALLVEIRNIFIGVVLFGIIQIILTVPIGYFGKEAVLGTVLGCIVAVLNFTLMGFILEKSVVKKKLASSFVGLGYVLRLAIIAAAVLWAIKVDYLNYVCVAIPVMVFTQLTIFIVNFVRKKERKQSEK